MRLLHFADLHLDTPFTWADRAVARVRRMALRDCLVRIGQVASEVRADLLCCAGDLYEQERFTPDTASFLRQVFADLQPLPVLLAPGNHDWLGPASIYRQVDWTDNVHVFSEPRLEPYPVTDGFTVWGAAHCAPANTPGFLDGGFAIDRGGVHIALFHGSERGGLTFEGRGKVPHAPFRADQIRQAGLDHALVGHFHTPRDAPDHTYPGNPAPLTFGEAGERGAVLVSVDASGAVTRERLHVAAAQVHEVMVDLSGVAHAHEIRQRTARALAGLAGVARVTLQGEVGPDVEVDLDDLTGTAPHLAAVFRLGRITARYDIDALAKERTVRGQFVADVLAAADLTEEQRRRVLLTGLRALAGRDDLEVR